jgi:hypothetical protein
MDTTAGAQTSTRPPPEPRRRLKVRGWTFASGAFAVFAILLASMIVLNPLLAARTDLRQISTAMSAFNVALKTLAPAAAGKRVDPATMTKLVAAERPRSSTSGRSRRRSVSTSRGT